jgi:hypothetical protein
VSLSADFMQSSNRLFYNDLLFFSKVISSVKNSSADLTKVEFLCDFGSSVDCVPSYVNLL